MPGDFLSLFTLPRHDIDIADDFLIDKFLPRILPILFTFLSRNDDHRPSLCTCALVSHCWKQLAIPKLYETVHFDTYVDMLDVSKRLFTLRLENTFPPLHLIKQLTFDCTDMATSQLILSIYSPEAIMVDILNCIVAASNGTAMVRELVLNLSKNASKLAPFSWISKDMVIAIRKLQNLEQLVIGDDNAQHVREIMEDDHSRMLDLIFDQVSSIDSRTLGVPSLYSLTSVRFKALYISDPMLAELVGVRVREFSLEKSYGYTVDGLATALKFFHKTLQIFCCTIIHYAETCDLLWKNFFQQFKPFPNLIKFRLEGDKLFGPFNISSSTLIHLFPAHKMEELVISGVRGDPAVWGNILIRFPKLTNIGTIRLDFIYDEKLTSTTGDYKFMRVADCLMLCRLVVERKISVSYDVGRGTEWSNERLLQVCEAIAKSKLYKNTQSKIHKQ